MLYGRIWPENSTSLRPERAPGAPGPPHRRVEPDELPDRVHAEAAGLHGIGAEVALEEPGVDEHVELGHDPPLRPAVGDLDDAIDHEHGRRRKRREAFGRRVLDQRAVRQPEDFRLRERGALQELGVLHEGLPTSISMPPQVRPEPTTTSAISASAGSVSQCWESTDGAPAAAQLPNSSTLNRWRDRSTSAR